MSSPAVTTIKRLFAFSGNRCAFPRCTTALVHEGVVTGEVCHIRGRKPDAPRFDARQTDDARHAFENLILLCPLHHKVIDADVTAYTVERLQMMKREHDEKSQPVAEPSDIVARQLIASMYNVTSINQSGGITAGVVHIAPAEFSGASTIPFNRARLETLLEGDRQRQVEVTNGLWDAAFPTAPLTRWEAQGPIQVGLIDNQTFEVRVPRGGIWSLRVPYDLVRAGWHSSDHKISLRLNGRPVLRPGGLILEPEA